MSIVQIALPRYPKGTDIPSFFKQLELCIHHARKAYEVQLQNRVGVPEDDYLTYKTPALDFSIKRCNDDFIKDCEKDNISLSKEVVEHLGYLSNFEDNFFEEKEDIEIEISVN